MTKRVCIFLWVLCSLFSCEDRRAHLSIFIENTDAALRLENGVQLYNGLPFTGTLTGTDSLNKTTFSTQYRAGKKEGVTLKNYKNGALAAQRFYKNGHKVGVHRAWWDNGNVKFEYHFNNSGAYHGAVKSWYATGQPYQDFYYQLGKEVAAQRMWQENGKIRANYVVKDGERFGLIGLKKCYSIAITDEKK